MKIGESLGADVPFCLMRATALAEGIGERLKQLAPLPFCYILLAKPSFSVSTASVFQELDHKEIKAHPDIEKMIYFIEHKNLKGVCSCLSNVLEAVTVKNYPIIDNIKSVMLKNNAMGSLMSGSGPTVFGIFSSKAAGLSALKELKYDLKIRDICLTTVFNRPNRHNN